MWGTCSRKTWPSSCSAIAPAHQRCWTWHFDRCHREAPHSSSLSTILEVLQGGNSKAEHTILVGNTLSGFWSRRARNRPGTLDLTEKEGKVAYCGGGGPIPAVLSPLRSSGLPSMPRTSAAKSCSYRTSDLRVPGARSTKAAGLRAAFGLTCLEGSGLPVNADWADKDEDDSRDTRKLSGTPNPESSGLQTACDSQRQTELHCGFRSSPHIAPEDSVQDFPSFLTFLSAWDWQFTFIKIYDMYVTYVHSDVMLRQGLVEAGFLKRKIFEREKNQTACL